MSKKALISIIVGVIALVGASIGLVIILASNNANKDAGNEIVSVEDQKNSESKQETLEDIIAKAKADEKKTTDSLKKELGKIEKEVDSYDKYVENSAKIGAFYKKIETERTALIKRLNGYVAKYAEMIVKDDSSKDGKLNKIENIHIFFHTSIREDMYTHIYDDICRVMYSDFERGVIQNGAFFSDNYDENINTNEQKQNSNCSNKTSSDYYALGDHINELHINVKEKISNDDEDGALEYIKNYRKQYSE